MPLPVVGRHVRHHFGPVDAEDESGIVGQRQRIGFVVGCVREDGTVILLDQRADPAAQSQLFQPFPIGPQSSVPDGVVQFPGAGEFQGEVGIDGQVASPSDYAGRALASERAQSIEESASGSARIGLAFVDVVLAQLAVVAGRAVAGKVTDEILAGRSVDARLTQTLVDGRLAQFFRPSLAAKRKCNERHGRNMCRHFGTARSYIRPLPARSEGRPCPAYILLDSRRRSQSPAACTGRHFGTAERSTR